MSVIKWDFATGFRLRALDVRGALLYDWEPSATYTYTRPVRCGPIEVAEVDRYDRELQDGTRVPHIRGYRKRVTVQWIVPDVYVTTGTATALLPQYVHNVVGAARGTSYLQASLDSGSTWQRVNVAELTQENLAGKNVGLRLTLVLELAELAKGPGCQSWATVLD